MKDGDVPPRLDRQLLDGGPAAREAGAAFRAELRALMDAVAALVAEHHSSVEAGVRRRD